MACPTLARAILVGFCANSHASARLSSSLQVRIRILILPARHSQARPPGDAVSRAATRHLSSPVDVCCFPMHRAISCAEMSAGLRRLGHDFSDAEISFMMSKVCWPSRIFRIAAFPCFFSPFPPKTRTRSRSYTYAYIHTRAYMHTGGSRRGRPGHALRVQGLLHPHAAGLHKGDHGLLAQARARGVGRVRQGDCCAAQQLREPRWVG